MNKPEYAHKPIRNEKTGEELTEFEIHKDFRTLTPEEFSKKYPNIKIQDANDNPTSLPGYNNVLLTEKEENKKFLEDLRRGKAQIPGIELWYQIKLVKCNTNEEVLEVLQEMLGKQKEKNENIINNIKGIFDEPE